MSFDGSRRHHIPADSKTTKELVPERLALSDGGKTTVLDLFSVELEGVLGELETLLHEGSKLTDAATFLTEDLLGVGGTDNDLEVALSSSQVRKCRVVRTSVRACVTRTSQPE